MQDDFYGLQTGVFQITGLYADDEKSTIRMSHLNPEVQALYKDYLGQPGSGTAERLLHTHYKKTEVYKFS